MKVTVLKKIKHLMPNTSSGTGYSEPDLFEIKLENGMLTNLWVDIWYCPKDAIKEHFYEAVNEVFPEGYIDNLDEMWDMYLDEISEHSCPYTKKEILKATKNEKLWQNNHL